jgi:ubiquinone/menaquinone biosynthesis C-methylase UbiE
MSSKSSSSSGVLFENPFEIEDIQVFDDDTLHTMIEQESHNLTIERLAHSLHGVSVALIERIVQVLTPQQLTHFFHELSSPLSDTEIEQERQALLDGLFWELIYWKMPEAYEELTEGERLHPGIFKQLAPELCGHTILDAGAGSGRASFGCLHCGAERIYAVDPSPGLLRLLKRKLIHTEGAGRIIPRLGRFGALPLEDNSVDVALSCSAFTAEAEQGGEEGLAELRRVTRTGGKIIVIWPRKQDRQWLCERGFQYVSLPIHEEMKVHFRSLSTAIYCARLFYAHNPEVLHYLRTIQRPEVPFSVIGMNPPRDYCYLSL